MICIVIVCIFDQEEPDDIQRSLCKETTRGSIILKRENTTVTLTTTVSIIMNYSIINVCIISIYHYKCIGHYRFSVMNACIIRL